MYKSLISEIFGPKPAPVVKEDWNNNFIDSAPEEEKTISLRSSKSTTSTTRQYSKSSTEEYLNHLNKTNSYHVKNSKSGTDLKNFESGYENLKKIWAMNSEFPIRDNKIKSVPTIPKMLSNPKEPKQNFKKINKTDDNKNVQNSKLKGWGDLKSSLLDVLPNKKKIDLYLNGLNGSSKIESESEDTEPNTLTHRINSEFLYPPPSPQKKSSFHLFDSSRNKCNELCRNFSSDSSGKKQNRRSRSHEKSTEKATVPVLRVSSMPRTDKKKESEFVKTNISQSATSLVRSQIINKQQLQKRTQRSIQGTRRKSKPRSPVRNSEKTIWKNKKNQITAKKKENIEAKSEKSKKIDTEIVQPKKIYLTGEEGGKTEYPTYLKTYPLAPSRIQSVRNRVTKTDRTNSGTNE